MERGGVNDKCQSTVYKSRYIIRYIYCRFVMEGGGVNDCCQYIETTYSVECDVMCDSLIINVIYPGYIYYYGKLQLLDTCYPII